jgi:hypothetical protein
MYTELINMASKFTSMVEDSRKHELMSRKTARQSLDFDSPPPKPAKYRHQQVTPPRHAHERIRARQQDDDDCERSFLCPNQTGSTRLRLQERWRDFGTKDKAMSTPEDIKQWIEDHAHAEMQNQRGGCTCASLPVPLAVPPTWQIREVNSPLLTSRNVMTAAAPEPSSAYDPLQKPVDP